MPNKTLTIPQVLTILAETPPHIAALTAGLAPAQLHTRPNPEAWSTNEVLAHLRACADVWGGCMETIITQDTPTLRAVNPMTWIQKTGYREQAFQPSLHAYASQRRKLMVVLEPLAPDGWARTATVTGAGNVLERTVLFYGRWLAGHERQHLKQIRSILNKLRL